MVLDKSPALQYAWNVLAVYDLQPPKPHAGTTAENRHIVVQLCASLTNEVGGAHTTL